MRISKPTHNILLLLMIAHVFFANTILGSIQVTIEVVLIIWFTISLFLKRFTVFEMILVSWYIVSSMVSFFTNTLPEFLLAAKVMGLGIVTIMYFSRIDIPQSELLKYVFIINSLLVVYQYLFDFHFFSNFISAYGRSWRELTDSRPLGLFISTHVSAYYSAIYAIRYHNKGVKLLLSSFMIYLSTSFFVLMSFISQLVWQNLPKFIVKRIREIVILLLFIFIYLLISINLDPEIYDKIIELPLALNQFDFFSSVRILGVQVVLGQFLNVEVYSRVFTLFPRSFNAIIFDWVDDFGNELMLFTLLQHGGVILIILYFFYLRLHVSQFLPFIIISLFHYGDVTTPLFLYMFIAYSKTLEDTTLHNCRSRSSMQLKHTISE